MSLHPPLVLVCIDHRSEANAGMRESGRFAVNVLAEGQEDVSRRFAAPGRAKLEGFELHDGKHGVPLVPGALAHVECRVRSFHDEGDHAVWVGEVRTLSAHPGRPLLYHAGDYRRLEGGPEWQARRRSVIKSERTDEIPPREPSTRNDEERSRRTSLLRGPWPRTC